MVATGQIPSVLASTLARADYQAHIENETKNLIVQVAARIAGKEIETKVVKYATTWWDAFKLSFLPTFCRILGHSPAITTITLTACAFYPSVLVPGHAAHVQVTVAKDDQS